jgi:hypothetical protein
MDTLSDRMRQLRDAGWISDLSVTAGRISCDACGTTADPEDIDVSRVERFEGSSDPGDEMILFAAKMPCGHRGLLTAAYGPAAPPEQTRVLARLRLSHHSEG